MGYKFIFLLVASVLGALTESYLEFPRTTLTLIIGDGDSDFGPRVDIAFNCALGQI